MRNLCILIAFVFTYTNLLAQGIPVSHTPEKKNVVLEEFTGMHCVNCPNGHYHANQLLEDNPGDVVVINVHAGGYAEPGTGEPDFRTAFGETLAGRSGLTGYPSATINRHIFPAYNSQAMAIVNRSHWIQAGNQVLQENAIANLGVVAEIDVQTNLLTVQVQVYYLGNATYPANARINVALLQDNIEGPQTGMAYNPEQILPNGNYLHKNMLRHLLTTAAGAKVPFSVGPGVTVDTMFAYSLPADIREIPLVISNLSVVAFVCDGINEVITGHEVRPTFINFPHPNSSKVLSATIDNNTVCGFTASPKVTIQNYGSAPLTSLYFDYTVNGSPTKTMFWTGNLAGMGEEQVTLDGINFFADSTNLLTVTTRLPNGIADPDGDDDAATVTFGNAAEASNVLTMTLQLDHYAAEVAWRLVNSAGTALYSSPTYTSTPNPTQSTPLPAPITATFTLTAGDCYEFIITDDYGDGLLGTGTGFTLEDNQGVVLLSNVKNYGSGLVMPFGVDVEKADSSDVFPSTGILSPEVGNIRVFPNPACGKINVDMAFSKEQVTTLFITDVLGKRVKTIAENQRLAGYVEVLIADFTPGIYFLNAEVAGKKYLQKILVTQ